MKKKRKAAPEKYNKEERERFLFRTAEEMRDINEAIQKRFSAEFSREESEQENER